MKSNTVKNCNNCNLPIAPSNYNFPKKHGDSKYCYCIRWSTLNECLQLSIMNAERLLEDAEYLFKIHKLSSSLILIVSAYEEIGKAQLAYEYMLEKKDVPYKEYKKKFLSHIEKIKATFRLTVIPEKTRNYLSSSLHQQRMDSMYVSYDWKIQKWVDPWRIKKIEQDEFFDLSKIVFGESAEKRFKLRQKAQESILAYQQLDLIQEGKIKIDIFRNFFIQKSKIRDSLLFIMLSGFFDTKKTRNQIKERLQKEGLNPKNLELINDLDLFVKWDFLKKLGELRISYICIKRNTFD